MRRAIVTTSATVSGIVLLLGLKPHGGTTSAQTKSFSIGSSDSAQAQSGTSGGSSGGSSSGGSSSGGTSGGSSGGSSSPTQAPTTTAPKSGSTGSTAAKVVTGEAADTRYGPVQLKVTFSGKKITKIDVLQYPTESGRDMEINNYALPILNQEAMSAQNAQIDAVSGATFTSDGYVQSLQSAIDQLGA